MGWFRRRRATTPARDRNEHTESVDVGGEKLVFWKGKSEEVEGEIYGPVWIADANDPNVTLEEHDAWLTWEHTEEFARKRGLPIEDV